MRYENFKYVEGTNKQCATVDQVGSFLFFKWKKTKRIMKDNNAWWHDCESGLFTSGFTIEYLERAHNANTTS